MWLDKYTVMASALSFATDRMGGTERERFVMRCLADEAKHFYHIFTNKGTHICEVPWIDDDNGGLPDWFFDGDYLALEVFLAKDLVEWVPAVGPAPIWRAVYSSFGTTDELWSEFSKWYKETY